MLAGAAHSARHQPRPAQDPVVKLEVAGKSDPAIPQHTGPGTLHEVGEKKTVVSRHATDGKFLRMSLHGAAGKPGEKISVRIHSANGYARGGFFLISQPPASRELSTLLPLHIGLTHQTNKSRRKRIIAVASIVHLRVFLE